MRVAILGAGLAGLCCAHELERHGVQPDIFELRHRVGERFPNMEAIVHLVHRPLRDGLLHFAREYGIAPAPSALIHTATVHSRNHEATLRGEIGYGTIRGNDERSLERQLAAAVRARIECGVEVSPHELMTKYDWVVVAHGTAHVPIELGIWQTDVDVYGKGSNFSGRFNPGHLKLWLDPDLAGQGYVYFMPFDERNAYLSTMTTADSVEALDTFWERTLERLGVHPEPKTSFVIESYKIGRTKKRQIDNMLLIGNAGGFVDPWMGFGQIPAMQSGVQAAEAMLKGVSFEELTVGWTKRYEASLRIREYFNRLDSEGFDRVVRLMANPLVQTAALDPHVDIVPKVAAFARMSLGRRSVAARGE